MGEASRTIFLKKFKNDVGFKEGPTVETKVSVVVTLVVPQRNTVLPGWTHAYTMLSM